MNKVVDITGNKYGTLKVVGLAKYVGGAGIQSRWLCQCDCGNEATVQKTHLRTGSVRSCGKCNAFIDINKRRELINMNAKPFENTSISRLNNKPTIRNTTGTRGVSITKYNSYKVDIQVNKKRVYVGTFKTLEEATRQRRLAEDRYFGEVIERYEMKGKRYGCRK